MREKVTFMAVAMLLVSAAPTMANTVFTDDFDGGFDQAWHWENGGGDGQAVISDGEVRLYSPGGYYSNTVGGYVAATYGSDANVSALVNCSGASTGNDQGVFARLQGANEFYGLNYDPFLNKLQLVYNQGAAFTNLAGTSVGDGAYGTMGREVLLRLQIVNAGDVVRLVGQAWDPNGTTLLADVQQIIDGTTSYAGMVVPVLGAGVSGVYAALNGNEFTETGGLSPLDARMDNFAATGDCSEGDANLDGVVDEADYAIVLTHWGSGDTWAEGDFNFDGVVDNADLASITDNWGGSGPAPSTVVPEPTTLCLLGMGAVSIYYRRRR